MQQRGRPDEAIGHAVWQVVLRLSGKLLLDDPAEETLGLRKKQNKNFKKK